MNDALPPDRTPSRHEEVGASRVRSGSRVVVIGGGPGGYEAALVARQLGAGVTLVERSGLGGAAVLTDVVPSKTLIATAEWMTITESAAELGISTCGDLTVDMAVVNTRVLELAARQSEDIRARLLAEGVRIVDGEARVGAPTTSGGRVTSSWATTSSRPRSCSWPPGPPPRDPRRGAGR